MHLQMSYCLYESFKTLASNHLGVKEREPLFDEIDSLLKKTEVAPAQVAEELKSEDANVALQALITRLKEMNKKKEDEKKAKDEVKAKKDSEKLVDPEQLTYFI